MGVAGEKNEASKLERRSRNDDLDLLREEYSTSAAFGGRELVGRLSFPFAWLFVCPFVMRGERSVAASTPVSALSGLGSRR